MRLVFMGTPEFAVPSLEALVQAGHEVVLVVTQPDRPAGRGRRLVASPVKASALLKGLTVYQPRRLREPEAVAMIAAARPEVVVVAAFGQILPPAVLGLPRHCCINVHASLLPRWRGAAPISAAILAGDKDAGVTIMVMEAGLDTGPTLANTVIPITPVDTTGTLDHKLARAGAELLITTLPKWVEGRLEPQPQDESLATYAPQLKKEDGWLEWTRPANDLWRRCRAFYPWPGAYTTWLGKRLKVLESLPLSLKSANDLPGRVRLLPAAEVRQGSSYPDLLPASGRVLAATAGDGELALLRVQAEGGKPVTGAEWAAGQRDQLSGNRLGLTR